MCYRGYFSKIAAIVDRSSMFSCCNVENSMPTMVEPCEDSDCKPTMLEDWFADSDCKPTMVEDWFADSECKPVMVEDWFADSDCKPVMVDPCVSTTVFNSLIAATAIGIVSEYAKPKLPFTSVEVTSGCSSTKSCAIKPILFAVDRF